MKTLPASRAIRPLRRTTLLVCAAALSAAAVTGCEQKAPPQQAPPPAAVTIAHPLQKQVIEWDVYTGHLESPERVSVVARVSGQIVSVPFVEGAIVKKGDLLVVIDDRPFKADLDAKIADQHKMESQVAINKLNLDRLVGVLGKAATQQEVDQAKADLEQAVAGVDIAKAAVETARLNLEWCRVTAPIDGRVGSHLVTTGNFVNGGAGQARVLTTIESVSPMYCYVDVDENSVLKYQRLAAEGKLKSARSGDVPCFAQIADETGYPHEGVIDFVDNHVDASTGTERIRGVFNNKNGELTPGLFARLRIPGSGRYTAMLLPDTAIGNDQDERSVLLVDKDNKVVSRRIKVGALFGNLRAIISGLAPDDRVIIEGQMHARPGAPVNPTVGTIPVNESDFFDPGASVAALQGPSGIASASPAEAPRTPANAANSHSNPASPTSSATAASQPAAGETK